MSLEKCGTFRSHSVPVSGTFVPTVYDYDFSVNDCADFRLVDFCLLNPYKGVLIANGQQGRVWFDRVYGQPIQEGIRIQLSFDCLRLNNINWWPYWSFSQVVWDYHKLNTVGLRTFRADGLFINNYFSIFHRFGWQVSGDLTNGTTFKAQCSNLFFDNCAYGYLVDTDARGHTASINNMAIQMDPGIVDPGAKPIFIVPDSCDIDIVNLSITLARNEAVRVSNGYNRISLHNLKVYDWAKSGAAVAAVIVDDPLSQLSVTGRQIFDLGGSNVTYAGAGKIKVGLAEGSASGTTSGTGDLVVAHIGRATPNIVKVQIKSAASINPVVIAATASNFTVRFFNTSTGAALISTPVSIDWQIGMQ